MLLKTIAHYRELGFTIAIDDLGAGYSGLKQWSELCPDFVKIDRYFIDHCDQSEVKKEFLKSITILARATNTQVIAEGIERPEELTFVENLGISNVQGFLLEKPSIKPSEDFSSEQLQALSFTQSNTLFDQSMAIGRLSITQPAISSDTRCKDAHKRFEQDKSLISIAVLSNENKPVGLLHRDQLTEVFCSALRACSL